MFPDRSTTPWLRTPGLIVIAGLYVLGVVATFAVTWAEYRYVASAGRLIGAAIIAVILIIAGMRLTRLRGSSRAGIQASRPAPRAWMVGIFAAVAASILVVAPWIPNAIGSTLTFLVIEAAAVITVTRWSHRPGWGDRQILALAAGPLFAYAWHAFISPPAFDSASIVIVRVSNVVFAALALAAVSIAARRISDKSE